MDQDPSVSPSARSGQFPRQSARFGLFDLDLGRAELRRKGRVVNLSQQSVVLLMYLLETAGKVVSREELQKVLWPSGTFVDFELALYSAVNRLRRDLGDSAAEPRFIETVPKQGYRFIAPVEFVAPSEPETSPTAPEATTPALLVASPDSVRGSESANANSAYRSRFLTAVAVNILLLALLTYALLSVLGSRGQAEHRVYRYSLRLPPGQILYSLAMSPAGDQVVYEAGGSGAHLLYRRYLDEAESRALQGTEGAHSPFFSPDGQSVGFYADGKLRIIGAAGIRTVASFAPSFDQWNAVWASDGYIYFACKIGDAQAIWRVHSAGGALQRVLRTTTGGHGITYVFPNQVLSHPRSQMIYCVDLGPLRRSLHVMDLNTHATKEIVERGVGGQILPTGHLLYYWNDRLFVAPFDGRALEFKGSPVEVVKDVSPYLWMRGQASVSDNGTLAYVKEGELANRRLEWIDKAGHITPLPLPVAAYEQAEVSPDRRKLAIVRREERSRWAVWIYHFESGAWTRLLASESPSPRAVWSPDSRSVICGSERANGDFVNLVRIPIAAPQAVERLTEQPDFGQFPQTWSGKANAVLFMEGVHPATNADIMALPLDGDRHVHSLVATPGWDRAPSFSPDGQFFAYESDRLGKPEVFIERYEADKSTASGPAVQISTGGGKDPVWSPDGVRIFYLDPEQNLMQADVVNGKRAGQPQELIHGFAPGFIDRWTRPYSVAPDGRFLRLRDISAPSENHEEIQIVLNWFEELKRASPIP